VNLFKSFPRNFYIAVVDLKGKNQVGANAIKLFLPSSLTLQQNELAFSG
jgi:hypothetical protein